MLLNKKGEYNESKYTLHNKYSSGRPVWPWIHICPGANASTLWYFGRLGSRFRNDGSLFWCSQLWICTALLVYEGCSGLRRKNSSGQSIRSWIWSGMLGLYFYSDVRGNRPPWLVNRSPICLFCCCIWLLRLWKRRRGLIKAI